MPKALSLPLARRRTAAATIAVGAVVGSLVAVGITAATPAYANNSERAASASATTFTVSPVGADPVVENARSTIADAAATVAEANDSGLDLGPESTAIDTSALLSATQQLASTETPSVLLLPVLTTSVGEQTELVAAQTSALRGRLDTALAKKAEEEAAARAAEAAAAALASSNTPEGAKAAARQIAADDYGWGGDQFSCLSSLWQKESGWNYQAYNANGGATGIPQALPGSKMASAGADWQSNAVTQIRWGLGYIQRAYGSPCSAWGHSQSMNWY